MFRYKAASMYMLLNKLVTLRLLWVLDNVPGMRDAVEKGTASEKSCRHRGMLETRITA